MSKIVTQTKCNSCSKIYNNFYISFGHPDKDFYWTWTCKKCGHKNKKIVKAMPMPHDLGWVSLDSLKNK